MNPYCTPKTRPVWPTLQVKIARRKVGTNRHVAASSASRHACYSNNQLHTLRVQHATRVVLMAMVSVDDNSLQADWWLASSQD